MPVHELGNEYLTVRVCGFGARLMSVLAPDRQGRRGHVVLGYDDEASYHQDSAYLGASVGRYGGRIPHGSFTLQGRRYQVPMNEGSAALHGGPGGFDVQQWRQQGGDARSVTFWHTSPDGDNGFPGELTASMTYSLDGWDVLLDTTATTDRTTVVNLLGHGYYNLGGGTASVDDHVLQVNASSYLPVGEGMLVTGELEPVVGTGLDLRQPRPVGAAVRAADPQLQAAGGLDHGFVLDDSMSGELLPAAVVQHPGSGRTLTVLTDRPALQVYSGNMLDGSTRLRNGMAARQGDALCLEPHQHLGLPEQTGAAVLEPGQELRTRTVLRFGVV